jgi:serine phosphatase RsbU (regulator of sigma subunit)
VIHAATRGDGIFADESILDRMGRLQAFNASVALTSFIFAAAVTERRQILHELYQREHRIAETLQRSMLPQLPELPGVELAARYFPSSHDSQVAGDWYDVISLSGDKLGLVVGDVVGHGLSAAAAMAQIRMGLRAYAMSGDGPAATLTAVNRMVMELHPGTMATLLYAEYDPGAGVVRVANAGHPPPLVTGAKAGFLECAPALPIGVAGDFACDETEHALTTGSTLVLFTDGLVERRGETIDNGLDALSRASGVGSTADIEALCDYITMAMDVASSTDDVAVLAVRPTARRRPTP